jgi:hypothetical protein
VGVVGEQAVEMIRTNLTTLLKQYLDTVKATLPKQTLGKDNAWCTPWQLSSAVGMSCALDSMLFSHCANADPYYREHCSSPGYSVDGKFGATMDGWETLANNKRMLMAWANPEFIQKDMTRMLSVITKRCVECKFPVRVVAILPFNKDRENDKYVRENMKGVRVQTILHFPGRVFSFWPADFWKSEPMVVGKAPWEVEVIMFENDRAATEFPLVMEGIEELRGWINAYVLENKVRGELLRQAELLKGNCVEETDVARSVIQRLSERIRCAVGHSETLPLDFCPSRR